MSASASLSRVLFLGLIGGAIGGWLGFEVFFWIASQGFYALALPAALLGLGAGLCARSRSAVLALICGLAGLALGLFTEWRFAPFLVDDSLVYFVRHVHELRPLTWIMVAIGAVAAAFLALGRDRASVVA